MNNWIQVDRKGCQLISLFYPRKRRRRRRGVHFFSAGGSALTFRSAAGRGRCSRGRVGPLTHLFQPPVALAISADQYGFGSGSVSSQGRMITVLLHYDVRCGQKKHLAGRRGEHFFYGAI